MFPMLVPIQTTLFTILCLYRVTDFIFLGPLPFNPFRTVPLFCYLGLLVCPPCKIACRIDPSRRELVFAYVIADGYFQTSLLY